MNRLIVPSWVIRERAARLESAVRAIGRHLRLASAVDRASGMELRYASYLSHPELSRRAAWAAVKAFD